MIPTMEKFAVTGPTRLTPAQAAWVAAQVESLVGPGDVLVSGAAHGVDTVAALAAHRRGAGVLLTLPAADFNLDLLDLPVERVQAPAGRDAGDAYMKRNDLTVQRCDVLLAFPSTGVERLRSGTWATVRRARKAGREVRVFPLDQAG